MREGPDIASLGALLGDPARANMLLALLRVPALTAGELAGEAGVTAQTASGHLRRLCEGGLLQVAAQGRHRYYGLADAQVGELLERLLGAAAHLGHNRSRPGPKDPQMRRARTCFDHMAGEIAVALFERMGRAGLVELSGAELSLTSPGHDALGRLGIGIDAFKQSSRPVCRSCLDWSERRPHLAGQAGAALLSRFAELSWVKRQGRTLQVTAAGETGFATLFAE
jgi:DNA-binding transcriptional ArsR family regulator